MNLFSKAKSLFYNTVGSPALEGGLSVSSISHSETEETNAKPKQSENIFTKAQYFMQKCIKYASKIVLGAIFFIVLGSLAPELREQIPTFYIFVEAILTGFERICLELWNFLDFIF